MKKLDEEGYTSRFRGGWWRPTKGSMIVAKGKSCCNLYHRLCGLEECAVVDDTTELWHRLLDHIDCKRLKTVIKREVLP